MNITDLRIDKMRYQKNGSSNLLVLISLILSIIALFTLINYDTFSITADERVVPDFRVGLEVVIGIIMMMTTFLAAEKVKFYDSFWSRIGLFILAGINVFRAYSLPLYARDKDWIPASVTTMTISLFIASALFLIAAGLIARHKVHLLNTYMKEVLAHGNNDA